MDNLTISEKRVLANALEIYMEGIEDADIDQKEKDWCEETVTSIEHKLLADPTPTHKE